MTPILLPVAELKPALSGLAKVIATRSSLPVLRHLKVERSADGWIAITATDLDRFITVRLEHPSEGEPASVLVPYEQLQQLVKNSGKDETLHLVPDPKQPLIRFTLGGQTGESLIKPMPVTDFPTTPRIAQEPVPLIADLRRFIQEAMTCCSADPTRPAINGICLDVSNPKGSYVVATDGKHLYSANSFTLPLKSSLLIPGHKFLAWKEFNVDGEWQLRADNQHVQIRSRKWRFVSRLIAHKYPDWQAVVPTADSCKTQLTLPHEQLDNLARLVQRLPNDNDPYQSLGLQWDGKTLSLLARDDPQDKWTQVPIQDTHGRGPEQTIMFDRRYLLKALDYGLNQISLIDEHSPLRFSNQGRQLIVMPVRPGGSTPKIQVKPVSASDTGSKIKAEVPVAAATPANPQPINKPTLRNRITTMLTRPSTSSTQTAQDTRSPESGPSMDAVIEEALALCSTLRDRFQEGLNQIRDLGGKLKLVQREQKSSAKEMSSVRSTLRTLQGLKL